MLELNNLSAGYGTKSILNGVTVKFEKGKLTSIIGVNSSGKSTMLKAILGILPLFEGVIAIDGKDLRLMSRNEIAKKIAYLSQGKNTSDITVGQLVLHGRFPHLSYPRRYKEIDRIIAQNAMDTVGITHFKDKPLHTLSGGMRQNAYIAMALAQETEYILLDEPTTYLDIAHQRELMKLLKKLADDGKGIVTVMHDLPMAFDFSDKIAVIDNGTLVAHSEPMEIYTSSIIKENFGVEIERLPNNKFYYKY